jgi:nucleoside-diphosphate-sugar epimerase
MRVLVLGGTGAMGVHLVKLLFENGIDTTVTSRNNRDSNEFIKYIQGDAHDITFLKSVLNNKWDVIVDFMVYSTPSFTERVMFLLKSTNQYVFISTARVYADSVEPIKESSSRLLDVITDRVFLSTDEYSLTKARQEDVLKNSSFTNWTIIRPYITYSENRFQLGVLEKEDWLYRALHGRTIVFSKDIISKLTTLTFGLDVSKGIFRIIADSSALSSTFHITVQTSNTWREVLDVYLEVLEKHLGYRPKVLLQDLDRFLEHHLAKDQVLYDRMYNRRFDNAKISNYIDTNDFIGMETGLKISLLEFLEKPIFQKINWHKEALKDRASKEHTSLTEINNIKDKVKYLFYRHLKKKINLREIVN